MKSLILTVALAAASLTSPQTGFAKEGSGVRGGEVVFLDGKYVNRDFLESSRDCWISGNQIVARQPGVLRILNSIARLDWYFSMTVEKKLNALEFCFGGPLKKIEIDTRNSPREEIYSTVFVALQNDRGQVYEDEALFNQISDPVLSQEDARGMHLIHEAIHSLISSSSSDGDRRQSVFLTMSTIKNAYLGQLTSRQEFHKNLAMADLQFPLTVAYLENYRQQIQFLSGDSTQRARIFFANSKLDILLNKKMDLIIPKLASLEERSAAKAPLVALSSYIIEVIESGSSAQVDYAFNSLEYTLIDVNSLAFGSYFSLPPERQAEILNRVSGEAEFSKAIEKIAKAGVSIRDGRIAPNEALNALAQKREFTVMELRPMTSDRSAPKEFVVMALAIKLMVEQDNVSGLTALLSSDAFYNALNLKNAKDQIQGSSPLVPRERTYSLEVIESLRSGVATAFHDLTKANLESDEFEAVSKLVQWNRLGPVNSK